MAVLGEIAFEVREVELEHFGNSAGIIRGRITRRVEEFDHDLRIGFAVKANCASRCEIDSPGGEGGVDGPPTGAGALQDGAVDVEEDELALHASEGAAPLSAAHWRQSVTPRRVQIRHRKVSHRAQG